MRIGYFISDHGFGHITRNLPVIAELAHRGHEVILITGSKQIEIAKEYLTEPVEYINLHTDAGLSVKSGSLEIDVDRTREEIEDNINRWPQMIDLAKALDADCFVVDIVPWALIAAKEQGIPSFFMASFTWLEQFEPFLDKEKLEKYRNALRLADYVVLLELVNKPTRELLGNGIEAGFVARPFHNDEVGRIRDKHRRKIVFLSLGVSNDGLNFDIDVSSLPLDFISTRALHLIGDNVEYLEPSVPNTQDYVKAADFCIAKAGWSTVSEMMLAGTKIAVLERSDTPEDKMTIEELKNRKAAISIKPDDLKDMGEVLYRMETFDYSQKKYENSYKEIADIICGRR